MINRVQALLGLTKDLYDKGMESVLIVDIENIVFINVFKLYKVYIEGTTVSNDIIKKFSNVCSILPLTNEDLLKKDASVYDVILYDESTLTDYEIHSWAEDANLCKILFLNRAKNSGPRRYTRPLDTVIPTCEGDVLVRWAN